MTEMTEMAEMIGVTGKTVYDGTEGTVRRFSRSRVELIPQTWNLSGNINNLIVDPVAIVSENGAERSILMPVPEASIELTSTDVFDTGDVPTGFLNNFFTIQTPVLPVNDEEIARANQAHNFIYPKIRKKAITEYYLVTRRFVIVARRSNWPYIDHLLVPAGPVYNAAGELLGFINLAPAWAIPGNMMAKVPRMQRSRWQR